MAKNMKNNSKRDIKKAATVVETAELVGVSPSMVRKVLNTDRKNDTVEMVFMELTERKNLLLEEVKKLIPII